MHPLRAPSNEQRGPSAGADVRPTGGRPLPEVVEAALRGVAGSGLPPDLVAVQLREKDLSGRALAELGHALRAVTAAAGAGLWINDRIDVALAVGAEGVHLGGASMDVAAAARVAGRLAIGVSAHGSEDVADSPTSMGPQGRQLTTDQDGVGETAERAEGQPIDDALLHPRALAVDEGWRRYTAQPRMLSRLLSVTASALERSVGTAQPLTLQLSALTSASLPVDALTV